LPPSSSPVAVRRADQRAAGLGWSAIATTVSELAGVRDGARRAYDRSSDLGMAVADVCRRPITPRTRDVPTLLESLPRTAPSRPLRSRRRRDPARFFRRSDPLTAKYIVKV